MIEKIITLSNWKQEEIEIQKSIEKTIELLKLQKKALKIHQKKISSLKNNNNNQ